MHKKFEINRTKIKGSCQSGKKVVPLDSKSDLPLSHTTTTGPLNTVPPWHTALCAAHWVHCCARAHILASKQPMQCSGTFKLKRWCSLFDWRRSFNDLARSSVKLFLAAQWHLLDNNSCRFLMYKKPLGAQHFDTCCPF